VRFEGITIRNGVGWTNTLVHCSDVTYDGCKVISFGPGGDGIDPLNCRNVTIRDCFLRCTDDCIAIKAPDPRYDTAGIRVADCTCVGFACSDGVTIGFETNAPTVSDIDVRNCDILLARGGSRVDGHSGFSIVCDGPAEISDVRFTDLRVDAVEFKLFELTVTDGTKYGQGPPGRIRGVTLRNITWRPVAPIVLRGCDERHRVSDVVFVNCTVGGRPLADVKRDVIRLGPFVDGVEIRDR
jgi:polygalacturonase